MPRPRAKDKIIPYLRSRTVVDTQKGCWEWQGSKNQRGYGMISVNGECATCHRISFELINGPIPSGLLVCHKCDNPACWRSRTSFLTGTAQDNVLDAVKKGRWPTGPDSIRSKLTADQIVNIRLDPRSTRVIARDYSVHNSRICRIKRGQCLS